MEPWILAVHGLIIVFQVYVLIVLLRLRKVAEMDSARNKVLNIQIKNMKVTLDSIVEDQKKHTKIIEDKVQHFSRVVSRVQEVMLTHHPEDKE